MAARPAGARLFARNPRLRRAASTPIFYRAPCAGRDISRAARPQRKSAIADLRHHVPLSVTADVG